MSLPAGTRLGPYEITAPIGAGGMGEVYKARDTRLDRVVAVKVAKTQFTERFEREARAVAALNHTNVCQLYDVGPNYLVMEFVEGQTLSGPLKLDDALPLIRQLIDGIEAAHEKNIVHRDLKPANVKITPEGVVKILDFGLAKASAPEPEGASQDSPTLTMGATVAGTILGTAAYMAPEQARGKTADKRSDIWSFGAVVYELLTGRRAFGGESVVETLGAVINMAPDWTLVPARARRLLKWCLEKDRKQRLQAIGDARRMLELEEVPAPPEARSTWVAWTVAVLGILAAAALAFVHFRETPPVQQSMRFQIATPGTAAADFLTLSPDGRMLAFVANNGGPSRVWVRAMDTIEVRALAGTEGATYPFWSPDGAWLGFFAQGKLKKIAVAGGPPQTLCDASDGRGGTWNRDGVILFSTGAESPILRVPAAGGVPSPVTRIAQGDPVQRARFPVFLPDGIHFLYDATSDKADVLGVYAGSLDGAAVVRILPDHTNAIYAPPVAPGGSGYLLFRREDTLMAQPFDPRSLKATGEMFPVAEQVPFSVNTGFGAFSISESGTLIYRSGGTVGSGELVWMDRAGKRLGVAGKPAAYAALAISPDERRVAVTIFNGSRSSDIWLEDLARGVLSRFTFRPGSNFSPVWSPDGSRVAFSSIPLNSVSYDIYQKPAGGNGQEELLLHAGLNGHPEDWSPDGKWIVYSQAGQKTGWDLWLLPLDGERKPVPYLQTPFNNWFARVSPDGRWMAYESDQTGQYQVYVQAIPPNGAQYQISAAGGAAPRWRRDGKELYYVSPDQKLMAVPIKLGSTVEAGTPQPLFPIPDAYAPSRDGQRFLVNVPAGGESAAAAPPVTVVLNWQTAIKKK